MKDESWWRKFWKIGERVVVRMFVKVVQGMSKANQTTDYVNAKINLLLNIQKLHLNTESNPILSNIKENTFFLNWGHTNLLFTDTFFPTPKKQEGVFKDLDQNIRNTYIKVDYSKYFEIFLQNIFFERLMNSLAYL